MTDAHPANDSTPRPPPLIQQLLESLGVPLLTRSGEGLAAAQQVQAALLEDADGTLLVLFPRSQLLDLARLAELTGRHLVAAGPARLGLTTAPCLYDERLLEQPRLYVESGQPGLMLELSSEAFRMQLGKASVARFGVPLADIRPNLDRPDDDRAEITQAVQAFTARRIQQRLEETIEIPPLSATAQRIIELRVNPNAGVEDLAAVVETDPALAAQVVSWAASPYYAAPGKIRSVQDAIVRVLGFDLVINLALGLALGNTLSLPKDRSQAPASYWQQAIYSAALIEGLARSMPRGERPELGLTYLCGLLHNFGYVVLAHLFPPHFALLGRHLAVNPHVPHPQLEQHLLGITREQIGSWLMRHWDMPEEIVTALRFQNDPCYAGPQYACANLVHLAVRLLRSHGIGAGPAEPVPDALLARLGLPREKAEDALAKVLAAEAALRTLTAQRS